jgi:hypothetical protein
MLESGFTYRTVKGRSVTIRYCHERIWWEGGKQCGEIKAKGHYHWPLVGGSEWDAVTGKNLHTDDDIITNAQ